VDGWITYSSSVRVLSCPQLSVLEQKMLVRVSYIYLLLIENSDCWIKTSHTVLYVITGASDTLTTVEEDHPTNRFNDAKCDRRGRLWAGTMGYEEEPGKLNPHMGSLYSFTGGTLLLRQETLTIQNWVKKWALQCQNDENVLCYYKSYAIFTFCEHNSY